MDSLSPLSITTRIVDTVTSGTLVCMEKAAQLSIGQTFLKVFDRFLWMIEKSAQWSLPNQDEITEENGKSFGEVDLIRPLPWVLFLPGLMLLRVLRISYNIGAVIVGYPSVEPYGVVKYLQKSRRRLRAIKSNGMRNMRQRKENGNSKGCEDNLTGDAKWRSIQLIRSIQLTLSSLSCLDGSKLSPSPPPTQIKVRMNHESTPNPGEKSATESASSPLHPDSKRKHSALSTEVSSEENSSDDSDEETVTAKIERLAGLDDSLDDDEFLPPDLSKSSGTSTSSNEDSDVSASEIQDIVDEANKILHRAGGSGVAEVIAEEPEPRTRSDSNERTGQKTKFENPNTGYAESENSQENQEFHSPCKFGEEGDSAFYSPISSKSSSPERTPHALEQGQQSCTGQIGAQPTGDACRNGELNLDLKAPISGAPNKTTNGHADEKRGNAYPTKINKPNYKGRRTSNASRKKK